MRPITKSQTGVGATDWVKTDIKAEIFNIGFGCVVDGTATYSIEHTFDDVDSGTPTAFTHSQVAGQTSSKDGNYAFPVRAIRLNVTAGAGTVTFTMIQAGCRG